MVTCIYTKKFGSENRNVDKQYLMLDLQTVDLIWLRSKANSFDKNTWHWGFVKLRESAKKHIAKTKHVITHKKIYLIFVKHILIKPTNLVYLVNLRK